jgi:tetratricopeptide (TPR) repeat protein
MSDNDAILAELRKLTAWADTQRRLTKWSLIGAGVVLALALAFLGIMEHRMNPLLDESSLTRKPEPSTWSDIDWNIRRANLDEAIKIGEDLIQKTPQYPEGHHRLGMAYLAAGKLAQAKDHFEQAFHLLPSEENQKMLQALQQRINSDNHQ